MEAQIINMDCRKYLNDVPKDYFDLCITSPPYNLGNDNEDDTTSNKYKEFSDNLDNEEYLAFLSEVIDKLLLSCKLVAFNIGYKKKNKDVVWRLIGKYHNNIKDIMIWHKINGGAFTCRTNHNILVPNYEFVIIFSKELQEPYDFIYSEYEPRLAAFNEYSNNSSNPESYTREEHTAIMPIQLARRLIKLFTEPGQKVYDPFLGSGTSGVACMQLNREFIGTDIIADYCAIAKQRIEDTKKQKKIFEEW